MPQAYGGQTVTDSAQILPGVIVNSDINDAAAIVYSKLALALGIVNADISASAGIVDTKLAQIATADKVSGAAITLLANVPAGAGVLPAANLPSFTTSNGSGLSSKVLNAANDVQTIAHGLGAAPTRIVFYFSTNDGSGAHAHGVGTYDTSGQRSIRTTESTGLSESLTSTTAAIVLCEALAGTNLRSGVVSVDATNITITWTKSGSPGATTVNFLWIATL